jgi:hypothetical protein
LSNTKNPDCWSAIIRRRLPTPFSVLKQDRALASRLAARARQQVEERFSVPVMVAATTRVYEQVLSC